MERGIRVATALNAPKIAEFSAVAVAIFTAPREIAVF